MIDWQPGDGTVQGIVASLAYLACGIVAFFLARAAGDRIHVAGKRVARARSRHRVWLVTAILFLLLAVERQIGLIELIADGWRRAAAGDDWYAQKATVQLPLLIGLSLIAAMTLAVGTYASRRAGGWSQAGIGGAILMGYIFAVKGVSLHALDAFLRSHVLGVQIIHAVEFVCLCISWVGMAGFARMMREEDRDARLRAVAIEQRLHRRRLERETGVKPRRARKTG